MKNKVLYFDIKNYNNICLCISELISNHINLNIHKDYDILFNDNTKFQNYLKELFERKNCKELDKLALNYQNKYPKLNLINKVDNYTSYHILIGICSKFNEEDIRFFCSEWQTSINIHKRKIYDDITELFENYFGVCFSYIPSPSTLSYINEHFKIVEKEYLDYQLNKLYLN